MDESSAIDKRQPHAFLDAHKDHLDYIASGIETKLPSPAENGILGVVEFAGSVGDDDDPRHEVVNTHGSRMIILDAHMAQQGDFASYITQFNREDMPEGTIAVIDVRSLMKSDEKFTNGVMLLKPQFEAHTLGRRIESNRDVFGWNEYTAAAISAKHLDIRITKEGVFVRDKGSTNGSVLATGAYVNQIIDRTPEHHEHIAHIRKLLGIEAVEDTVVVPEIADEILSEGATAERLIDRPRPTSEAAKERVASMIAAGGEASTLAASLIELGDRPESIVHELGINSDARDKVRSALMVRLNMLLDEMPDQVKKNAMKNTTRPDDYDYDAKMPSQDYAVAIAMAYLDGTFNNQHEVRDGHGEGGIGEHRTAAQKILESFVQHVPEQAEKLRFGEDKLHAYTLELRGDLEEMAMDVGQLAGQYGPIDALRNVLYQSIVDTDQIGSAGIVVNTVLDRISEKIQQQMQKLANLQQHASFRENRADNDSADQIQAKFRYFMNQISEIQNSIPAAYIMRAVNGMMDETSLMQLRATNNNNTLENEYFDPIQKIPTQLREFIDQLT